MSINKNDEFIDSVKFIAKNVFIGYSAERLENQLIIDFNLEAMVGEIMKQMNSIQKIEDDVIVVLQVGEHSIRFSKEVEVVKTVKTKGWNISK